MLYVNYDVIFYVVYFLFFKYFCSELIGLNECEYFQRINFFEEIEKCKNFIVNKFWIVNFLLNDSFL